MKTMLWTKTIVRAVLLILLSITLGAGSVTARDLPASPRGSSKPLVQIAILLDTSGSMEGLIEQAKSQL